MTTPLYPELIKDLPSGIFAYTDVDTVWVCYPDIDNDLPYDNIFYRMICLKNGHFTWCQPDELLRQVNYALSQGERVLSRFGVVEIGTLRGMNNEPEKVCDFEGYTHPSKQTYLDIDKAWVAMGELKQKEIFNVIASKVDVDNRIQHILRNVT